AHPGLIARASAGSPTRWIPRLTAIARRSRRCVAQLDTLVRRGGSTLGELSGLSTQSVAELLVEVGDPRRFTEGGFARFIGSAPLPRLHRRRAPSRDVRNRPASR